MTNEIFEAEEAVSVEDILAESSDACSGCDGCSEVEKLL